MPAFNARKQQRFTPSDRPTQLAPPLGDVELRARLLQGDRWAREAFYRKYVQSVWGLALRLLGDREAAERAVEDTFVRALRELAQLEDRRALHGWLMGLTVAHAQRSLQRRRVLHWFGFRRGRRASLWAEQARLALGPEYACTFRRLAELLDRMPLQRRVVWCLRCLEGCSLDEVAEYCALSLAQVGGELRLARASVAARLGLELELEGARDE